MEYDVIVMGGPGLFAALRVEKDSPDTRVVLLEKTAAVLSKMRISDGRRCNVTHVCFEPSLLSKNYPKEGKGVSRPLSSFFNPKTRLLGLKRGGAFEN